jgi:hypothetical protein
MQPLKLTRNTHKHTNSLTIRFHTTKSFAISSDTSGSTKEKAQVASASNDRLFISTKFGKRRAVFLKLEMWPQQKVLKNKNIQMTYIHNDSNPRE